MAELAPAPLAPAIQAYAAQTASLRLRLRRDTRAAHERVDQAAAGLDLARADHRSRFVRAHGLAYHWLSEAGIGADGLVAHRLTRAHADGFRDPQGLRPAGAVLPRDDLGVRYVIAGSHLGNRMMARLWTGAPSALLADEALAAHWSDLLLTLKDRDGTGPAAEAVLTSARATFGLFERAFAQLNASAAKAPESP